MPAHTGLAAVGAGEAALGQGVIAPDVFAEGGDEKLMAGGALVIAGLRFQDGRRADARDRRRHGQRQHGDARRDGRSRYDARNTSATTAMTVMAAQTMERAKRFLFS